MLRREHLSRFGSARDAKEFLVSKIVEEAPREGVPLSEVERKMLYFSETDWTLPDMMEVNEAFDREYDQDEYEKKIAQLVRHARARTRKENPQELEDWKDAIGILSKEDHYILAMLEEGGVSVPNPPEISSGWRFFGTLALATLAIGLALSYLTRRFGEQIVGFYTTLTAFGILGVYFVLRFVLGPERMDTLVQKVLERVLGS